jgi:hypothetical protein
MYYSTSPSYLLTPVDITWKMFIVMALKKIKYRAMSFLPVGRNRLRDICGQEVDLY